MKLYPFGKEDYSGLMLSCRRAKQELDEEAAHTFWIHLQKLKEDFDKV